MSETESPQEKEYTLPNSDAIIQAGVDGKDGGLIGLGLELTEEELPFNIDHYDFSFAYRKKSEFPDQKMFGDFFNIAEIQAIETLTEVAKTNELGPRFRQKYNDILSNLLGTTPESKNGIVKYALTREEALARFQRDATHIFSPDVIQGVVFSNSAFVNPENRAQFENAQRLYHQTFNRLLLMKDIPDQTKKQTITAERLDQALADLDKFDLELFEEKYQSMQNEGDNPDVYTSETGEDELEEAVEIGPFSSQKYQLKDIKPDGNIKIIDRETQEEYEIPIGSLSFRPRHELENSTFLSFAHEIYAMDISNNFGRPSQSWERMPEHANAIYDLRLLLSLGALKKELLKLKAEPQSIEALQELFQVYSQTMNHDTPFGISDIQKTIKQDGTLYPLPALAFYRHAMQEEPTQDRIPEIGIIDVNSIFGKIRVSRRRTKLLHDYLLEKGFSLPYLEIDPDSLDSDGEDDENSLFNSSVDSQERRRKTAAIGMEGAPAEIQKVHELVYGKNPEGRTFQGYSKPVDTEKTIKLKNIERLKPNAYTVPIPLPKNARIEQLKVISEKGTKNEHIMEMGWYKILENTDGTIFVQFDPIFRNLPARCSWEVQFHLEDEQQPVLPESLNNMDTRILWSLGTELEKKYGFQKLKTNLHEALTQARELGEMFSIHDLERCLFYSGEYSHDENFALLPESNNDLHGVFEVYKDFLDTEGKFQYQCDGAAPLAKAFLQRYFEEARVFDLKPEVQSLYSHVMKKTPQGAVFSKMRHAKVAIFDEEDKPVMTIDTTPSDPNGFEPVDSTRSFTKKYVAIPTQEEHPSPQQLLLQIPSYTKWLNSLSDMSAQYFGDLPFLALPRMYEEIQGKQLTPEAGERINRKLEEQIALLQEYQREMVTEKNYQEKLPTIKGVSNNAQILGLLSQLAQEVTDQLKS